jgi:hypothetical protein
MSDIWASKSLVPTVQLLYSGTGGIYSLHLNDTVVEGVGDIQSIVSEALLLRF